MNKSIDKMAMLFTSVEELQAYADSQYKTILSLNQKITEQEKELNQLREDKAKASVDKAISEVDNGQFKKVADEEAICVMQISILKAHSMERELISDEVKRLEILVKTLLAIRGQDPKKGKPKTDNMSTEDLLKQYEETLKDPQ